MKKSKAKPKRPIKLRKRTEELLNKNPAVIKKIPSKDVRNLLEDLQIYQIELEKYSNELQKAHEDLRESEKRFRRLVETMNDGIGIQDENGLITYVNNKFCQMLDYKSDDFIGKPVTNFLDDHNSQILKNQTSVRKKGKVKPYEIEWTCKDGRKIQTIMSPQAIFNDNGQFKGSFSVITDISSLKQTEELLRKSEERYRAIFDQTFQFIGLLTTDGILIEANRASLYFYGIAESDVLGIPFWEAPWWTHSTEQQNVLRDAVRRAALGEFVRFEAFHPAPDGIIHYVDVSIKPVKDEAGNVYLLIPEGRDITDRKQAEDALRESEERYRSLAENSLVGFWHITLEGHSIYLNPAMCSMLEIKSPEELSGQTYHPFFTTESLEIIKHERTTRPKGKGSSYEVEIIGKNGGRRNVMICGAPVLSTKGKLHGYIATFTDITDRKRAEEKLREAHDELEHRVKERTRELEIKTNSLEEINTAMKVLLQKREEDKTELEDNVLTNVKELIVPYFEKIKKTKLDDHQEAFLSIIESNLNEIVSPFTRKMSLKYLNLTPTEIQIANLIRHGSSTKKIAETMNVSPRTVETHRKNIRRKIGLDRKKANLRSHLLTLH